MAGVTSSYPAALDSESNLTPPNNGDTLSVADHWLAGNAGPIVAIETELGTDPAGSFTDVKSRLNDTDGKVITEIDMFELTSNYSLGTINTDVDLTANLARVSGGGFSQKGTGVQEGAGSDPAGVFSFPSTGYYLIHYVIGYTNASTASQYSGGQIRVTEDNFSTGYSRTGYTNIYTTGTIGSINYQLVFKVDDISTHKCKFVVHSRQTVTVVSNYTYMNFIRLGDV